MEQFKNAEVEGYEVSNYGKVFTKRRKIRATLQGTTRIIERRQKKPSDNGKGYMIIILSKEGKNYKRYVHRLVAMAFIPNPENKPTVNHKDGNKCNNHVDNLEWATYKEQAKHAMETGLARLGATAKEIDQLDLKGVFIKRWPSACEAHRELGIARSSIQGCCKPFRKGQKTAGGYKWKFSSVK